MMNEIPAPPTDETARLITLEELRRNTGERGSRVWIARDGIVYDVTECAKWRTGLHEALHFAGQDLSLELPEAPHGEEVFQRKDVRRVGFLAPANED